MANSSFLRSIIPDAVNRDQDDFYVTPRRGIEALLDVEKFDESIWECACGDGAISRVLVERGHHVISTDLVDRGYGTRPRACGYSASGFLSPVAASPQKAEA
jgi:hypothetical protein